LQDVSLPSSSLSVTLSFSPLTLSLSVSVANSLRSDDDTGVSTSHGVGESFKTGVLSDDESNGFDTSASGSEISQTDEPNPDFEIEAEGVTDGKIESHQHECPDPSLSRDVPDDDDDEALSPVDTFSLPIDSPEGGAGAGEGENHHSQSLLSSLDEEFNQNRPSSPSPLLSETRVHHHHHLTPEALQQQLDDEFEVVTLQRMKSLRQRIIDSLTPKTNPPLNTDTVTEETVVVPPAPSTAIASDPQETATVAVPETVEAREMILSSSELNGIVDEVLSPAAVVVSQEETPIISGTLEQERVDNSVPEPAAVVVVVEGDGDDEPRERSCTVDSDDELE
jgi:hypothetical protein